MRIFPNCGGLKTSKDHLTALAANLDLQRKNGDTNYCDITLICDNTRFQAHKAILVGSSSYFECLIGGLFAESKQSEIDITESIASPEILEAILDFIYAGKLPIDGNNFRELLDASCLLLLDKATDLLAEYLKNSLVIGNCLDIFQLAYKYSLDHILRLCVIMIQSRMHDYFRHMPDILDLPLDAFVYLYDQDVFIHTHQQDISILMKDYIENLFNVHMTDVSENGAMKLYQITQRCGMREIPKVLDAQVRPKLHEAVSEDATTPGSSAEVNVNLKKDVLSNSEDDEILIVATGKEKHVHPYGWLKKTSRWIKFPSVNAEQIGCIKIDHVIGFANNSLVFKATSTDKAKDIIICPLDGEEAQVMKEACDFCVVQNRTVNEALHRDCPHVYFTAWNELFCLKPLTKKMHVPDYEEDEDLWRKYIIVKYSPQHDGWKYVGLLDVPEFYYWSFRDRVLVASLKFHFLSSGADLYVVLANTGTDFTDPFMRRYMTIMQLSKDSFGNLQSQILFNRERSLSNALDWHSDWAITLVSGKINFYQGPKGCWYTNKSKLTHFAVFDLSTSEFRELDAEEGRELLVPKAESNIYRYKDYYPRFHTPSQDGCFYHVATLLPYVNVTWCYDPIEDEWKSLPGPHTLQQVVWSVGEKLHVVPQEIFSQLASYPTGIFEDTYEGVNHGPFSDL